MKKIVTKLFVLTFIFSMLSSLQLTAIATDNRYSSATDENDKILYQYTKEELDSIVFTMDSFNSTFTRKDVANIIALNKATKADPTYEYINYTATEDEINDFYAKMEEIALAERPLSYYFNNVYWRLGTIRYNGSNIETIILTLSPTSAMKEKNLDGYNTYPAWLLVKAECGNSVHWTNEGSIKDQFYCHAQGEILGQRGIIDSSRIGDWDIEPIRSATFYFEYIINNCNPDGSDY